MSVAVKWFLPAAAGVAGLVAILASSPAGSGSAHPASVKLVSEAPFVLAGRGFHAQERVVVKVFGVGGVSSKSVIAGARGEFTARFAQAMAACGPLTVSAVGARGSRASFRRRGIPPPCGIPIQP